MKFIYLILLIILNLIPLYGVFFWGWQSFDLIFLYWLENLVIGFFTLIRFVVRPYSHPFELFFPLFLAPFFVFHYGMFCYVHGSFVISLFGSDVLGEISKMNIPDVILPVVEMRHLLLPAGALFLYQLIDYCRDTIERGLGSDNIKELMIAPYRRIIVLHITIIASGFALAALKEPIIGLVILIILKICFDIYFWQRDEKQAVTQNQAIEDKEFVIDDNIKAKIDEMIDNPTIVINGQEKRFDTYEEFQASSYYGMMKALVRMTGGAKKWKMVEQYVQQRLEEKVINHKETG